MTGRTQTVINLERLIEVRIINQTLPANRGARLLEINPHHQTQLILQFSHGIFEPACVLKRTLRVMDRAGPDDYQEPVVAPIQNARDFATEFVDRKSTRLNSSHIPLSRMP